MLQVSDTEIQNNLDKYLKVINQEDVIIIKNGQKIARLTSLEWERKFITDSLVGILPKDIDEKVQKYERTKRIEK